MSVHVKASFKITSWDQHPYDEPEEGPKLLKTAVKKTFQGDIEAESTAILLMCQGNDDSAGYVATEKIVGRIGSRIGSFVIQHGGAAIGTDPVESFGYVVPGSGTGDLKGLRGKCTWHHDEHEAIFTLDYEIV